MRPKAKLSLFIFKTLEKEKKTKSSALQQHAQSWIHHTYYSYYLIPIIFLTAITLSKYFIEEEEEKSNCL